MLFFLRLVVPKFASPGLGGPGSLYYPKGIVIRVTINYTTEPQLSCPGGGPQQRPRPARRRLAHCLDTLQIDYASSTHACQHA